MQFRDLIVKVAADDAGRFEGYASRFDEADDVNDEIAPGAFAASLQQHADAGTRPLMLWQHDPAEPIGVWLDLLEDRTGLKVSGSLVLESPTAAKAYALLKAGALNGLSIGFRTVTAKTRPGGGRRITALDLIEISLVSRPALASARVSTVKTLKDAAMPNDTPPASTDTEARLGTLEQSVTALDTRLKKVEEGVNSVAKSAERIETQLGRPGLVDSQKAGSAEVEAKSFGIFIRKGREALADMELKSLTVSPDTAGGFLAPPQFVAEMLRNLVQFSPVRSIARVANTTSPAVLLPKRTGGFTAAWVGETDPRPATTATFGQNRYDVRELAAHVDVSNALLEDSAFDIAAELAFEFAEEFGRAEGAALVNGSGALQPGGFANDPAIMAVNSGDAAEITADGLIDLYHSLPTAYRAKAVWTMAPATVAACRKLKDTTGNYLLATGGIANAPETTLLGRPIVEMVDLPAIAANAFPVFFGDFKQAYRIFDRVAVSILRDPYSIAVNGMTRFHARRRLAAGVAKADALRKLKIAA